MHILSQRPSTLSPLPYPPPRYIAAQMKRAVRFVGLSTALANAQDLADWLGIGPKGLFNFKPSVRPVPLECHIQGYPGVCRGGRGGGGACTPIVPHTGLPKSGGWAGGGQ